MGPQARASFAEAETIGRRLDHGLKKRKQKKKKKKRKTMIMNDHPFM